jgi:DNA-binding response OmpR family regulator
MKLFFNRLQRMPVRAAEPIRRRRLLIAEADDLERGMQEALLRIRGFDPEGVQTANAAILLASASAFDLLIAHQDPPRLDACSIIRRLRGFGCKIPILLMSSSSEARKLPHDITALVHSVLPAHASGALLISGIENALRSSPPLSTS